MHTHSSGSPANYLRNDYSPLCPLRQPRAPKSPTSTSDLVHIDYPRAGQTSGALMPHLPMFLHSRSRSGRFGHLSGIRSHLRHRTLVWIMRYHAYSLLIHLSVPYHFSSICFNTHITSPYCPYCLLTCFAFSSHFHHSTSLLHLPQGRYLHIIILSFFYPSIYLSNHMLCLSSLFTCYYSSYSLDLFCHKV
ncbi:hypothetical protein B0H16DRAFT_1519821, partial [Mycena metata]